MLRPQTGPQLPHDHPYTPAVTHTQTQVTQQGELRAISYDQTMARQTVTSVLPYLQNVPFVPANHGNASSTAAATAVAAPHRSSVSTIQDFEVQSVINNDLKQQAIIVNNLREDMTFKALQLAAYTGAPASDHALSGSFLEQWNTAEQIVHLRSKIKWLNDMLQHQQAPRAIRTTSCNEDATPATDAAQPAPATDAAQPERIGQKRRRKSEHIGQKRHVSPLSNHNSLAAFSAFPPLQTSDEPFRFQLPHHIPRCEIKGRASPEYVFNWFAHLLRHLALEVQRLQRTSLPEGLSVRNLKALYHNSHPDVPLVERYLDAPSNGFTLEQLIAAAKGEWPQLFTPEFLESCVNKRSITSKEAFEKKKARNNRAGEEEEAERGGGGGGGAASGGVQPQVGAGGTGGTGAGEEEEAERGGGGGGGAKKRPRTQQSASREQQGQKPKVQATVDRFLLSISKSSPEAGRLRS